MEPFIKSVLNVAQRVPTRELTGLSVGVVIDSKVGPIEQTVITSPRQFLETYTTSQSISKGDHPSLQNAYYLSRFVDLVVVRATNSTVIPLTGFSTLVDSYKLPSGLHSDGHEVLQFGTPANVGDVKSLWFQVDNVLFYGSDGINPFEDGDGLPGGTATRRVKGTESDQLMAEGLGVETDWYTVQLTVPLASESGGVITYNPDALGEIAEAFKKGGAVERGNLHVEVFKSYTLKVHFNSDYPVDSSTFQPLDRDGIDPGDPNNNPHHNVTSVSEVSYLSATSEPYLIGTTNVGSINTVKAWITDRELRSDGFQYWTLNLEDPIRGHLFYSVSDNPDATDTQGNPIYYTTISEIRPDILYYKNERSTEDVSNTVEPGVANIGRSQDYINSTLTKAKLNSAAQFAATSFEEYNSTRIQLYTDAGWYNAGIAKAFENICPTTKSLACIGIDPIIVDENVIISYAAMFNGFYSIIHANGGKDTSVTGFQIPISPSCYYIESLARNNTRNNTYAPVFSKVNGPVSQSNLFHSFSKSARDKMNKANVNVLVYDNTDGVSYINNNLISDTSGSLITEDQSIRIINDIQFDIDKLMENFYSRFNVDVTRSLVESALNNYFESVIMPQNYTISGYRVECSAINNTQINIENNELKVDVYIQLNHSIKYITVTTNVVPTL